jgi:hypothetical protein
VDSDEAIDSGTRSCARASIEAVRPRDGEQPGGVAAAAGGPMYRVHGAPAHPVRPEKPAQRRACRRDVVIKAAGAAADDCGRSMERENRAGASSETYMARTAAYRRALPRQAAPGGVRMGRWRSWWLGRLVTARAAKCFVLVKSVLGAP